MKEALYIAVVIGAISLYMMMPRRGYSPRNLGALLGACTLGGLWLVLARHLPEKTGLSSSVMVYHYIFSALAIGSAARVITHTRPVVAALWFVMVILATSGLLVILGATFIAFAMIIIYAGAILVTYVFVIMLAAQADDPQQAREIPEYERVAREPASAVAVGFLLLAMFCNVNFEPMVPNQEAVTDIELVQETLKNRPIDLLTVREGTSLSAGGESRVQNVERLGFDLFNNHPLGLELAGVILLVALIGAVSIVRQQITPNHDVRPPVATEQSS